MNITKTLNDFLKVLSLWEKALEGYQAEHLKIKAEQGGWTLGQLYNHLIGSALNFHIKEMEKCLASEEGRNRTKNVKGFMSFNILHGFPPVKISVPPSEEYTPAEEENPGELANGLKQVRGGMEQMAVLLKEKKKSGKTAHPALGYLNACEWFRLVEMHYRHHLRQKETFDEVIKLKAEQNG